MQKKIAAVLGRYVEDIALSVGTVSVGVGAGLAFGPGIGLLAFGVLCVGYGVWITERGQ